MLALGNDVVCMLEYTSLPLCVQLAIPTVNDNTPLSFQ